MTGAERIAAERQRQIDREGWTPEHDDEHTGMELTYAARCYAEVAAWAAGPGIGPSREWPFDNESWKPSGDRIRDLERAGALIAAEIDRLQRVNSEQPESVG